MEVTTMRKYSVNGFERISKAEARRMYCSGKELYLCAVNMRPDGPCGVIRIKTAEVSSGASATAFAMECRAFRYYNCTSAETGRYAAFYKREAETV
jgi:hypothetical protein